MGKRIVSQLIKKVSNHLPSSYILMFHHVTSQPKICMTDCMLDEQVFKEIVSNIENIGTVYDSLFHCNKGFVSITFDDGLEDVYSIAFPFLSQYGIPFTVFVVTGFLDKPGYISTEQLIEMSKTDLVTIGSHGLSHKLFTNLTSEQKERELVESKSILEAITSRNIDLFAYSHGVTDKETIGICKKKYRYAFGTAPIPVNCITKVDRWRIPRYNFDNDSLEKRRPILEIIKK